VDRLWSYNFAMSLDRFLQAQEQDGSYDRALAELKAGRKKGCWIWWVIPQLKGLGSSHNSTFYGLADEAEARAYLEHPILGARYRECVEVVHGHLCKDGLSPLELMGGEVDVLKLCSSLEIFFKVASTSASGIGSYLGEILESLKVKGIGDMKLLVDSSERSHDLYFKDFGESDAERFLSGGHVLLAGIAGTGKTLLIRSKLMPWLHARGAHFVICDYHGDYADDFPDPILLDGEFDDAEQLSADFRRKAAKALASTSVISPLMPFTLHASFPASLISEVLAGRGPKSPWFLIVDLSSDTYRMGELLDFIPVAKRYGCTLIITAQLLGPFKPYLFTDIAHVAQFSPSYQDDLIRAIGRTRGMIFAPASSVYDKINMLRQLEFIAFSGAESSQGYRLHRTPGYGTRSDPVLP
jgi:uncharacterized protein (DUF1810 family)